MSNRMNRIRLQARSRRVYNDLLKVREELEILVNRSQGSQQERDSADESSTSALLGRRLHTIYETVGKEMLQNHQENNSDEESNTILVPKSERTLCKSENEYSPVYTPDSPKQLFGKQLCFDDSSCDAPELEYDSVPLRYSPLRDEPYKTNPNINEEGVPDPPVALDMPEFNAVNKTPDPKDKKPSIIRIILEYVLISLHAFLYIKCLFKRN